MMLRRYLILQSKTLSVRVKIWHQEQDDIFGYEKHPMTKIETEEKASVFIFGVECRYKLHIMNLDVETKHAHKYK